MELFLLSSFYSFFLLYFVNARKKTQAVTIIGHSMGSHLMFVIKRKTLFDYSKTKSKGGQELCMRLCTRESKFRGLSLSLSLCCSSWIYCHIEHCSFTLPHFRFHLTLTTPWFWSLYTVDSRYTKNHQFLRLFSRLSRFSVVVTPSLSIFSILISFLSSASISILFELAAVHFSFSFRCPFGY